MKIIFLNCWHAKVKDKLFDFFVNQAPTTDAFCLQEFDPEFSNELSKILLNFNKNQQTKEYINNWYFYNSIFIKKDLNFVTNCKKIQAIKIKLQPLDVILCNIHGVSMPGDKKDSQERIKQSQTIIDFLKDKNGAKIIGGDFNLNPDTKSVKMFEDAGYVNLIKEFRIKSTRNHFAWEQAEAQQKQFGWQFFGRQYFADYCFVSKDIKVKSFTVPEIEVSDHLPLILEFEV